MTSSVKAILEAMNGGNFLRPIWGGGQNFIFVLVNFYNKRESVSRDWLNTFLPVTLKKLCERVRTDELLQVAIDPIITYL